MGCKVNQLRREISECNGLRICLQKKEEGQIYKKYESKKLERRMPLKIFV